MKNVRLDVYVRDGKGQSYKKLKPSYVIIICAFDIFNKGRHIYTFENTCREDNSVFLEDGGVKIFLNTDSGQDDVSKDLKAFFYYVVGKELIRENPKRILLVF